MNSDGFLRTFGFTLYLALIHQIHARFVLDHESYHFQHAKALNITSKTNVTTAHESSHPTVALQAPKYPNITIGQAWVYPSSQFDLGARAMSCECFAPDNACCISNTIHQPSSQFCMPSNSTCCGNTFCPPKSTCCGDFCCDLGNSCVTSPTAGCCPLGKTCLPTVKCYDHSSDQCTGEIKSPYCCSDEAPFCRTEESHGLACYANSAPSSSPTTTSAFSADTTIGIPHLALQTPTSTGLETIDNTIPASLIFPNLNNNIILASSSASLVAAQSAAPTSFAIFSGAASPAPLSAQRSGVAAPSGTGPASPTTTTAATVPGAASNATIVPASSAGMQMRPLFLSLLWGKDGEAVITNPATLPLMVALVAVVLGYLLVGGGGFDVKDEDEEGEELKGEELCKTSCLRSPVPVVGDGDSWEVKTAGGVIG